MFLKFYAQFTSPAGDKACIADLEAQFYLQKHERAVRLVLNALKSWHTRVKATAFLFWADPAKPKKLALKTMAAKLANYHRARKLIAFSQWVDCLGEQEALIRLNHLPITQAILRLKQQCFTQLKCNALMRRMKRKSLVIRTLKSF